MDDASMLLIIIMMIMIMMMKMILTDDDDDDEDLLAHWLAPLLGPLCSALIMFFTFYLPASGVSKIH